MPVLARARIEKNTRTTAPREVRKLLKTGNGNPVLLPEHIKKVIVSFKGLGAEALRERIFG